jgi:hypothetical protein
VLNSGNPLLAMDNQKISYANNTSQVDRKNLTPISKKTNLRQPHKPKIHSKPHEASYQYISFENMGIGGELL